MPGVRSDAAQGGKGRRRGDLRSSRARPQLRGDAAITSRAWSEDAGAAAAPLPASPPRNYRTGKIFPNCIMKPRSPDT